MSENAGSPAAVQAEDQARRAARLMGTAHGAAGLTPFTDDGLADDNYARQPDGYTNCLEWADGVAMLLAALGVPASGREAGWRIARDYIRAYDAAWDGTPGGEPATPVEMIAQLREMGLDNPGLRACGHCAGHPAGFLPDGRCAVVLAASPCDSLDQAMAAPLAVAICTPAPDGGPEPGEVWGELSPAGVLRFLAQEMTARDHPEHREGTQVIAGRFGLDDNAARGFLARSLRRFRGETAREGESWALEPGWNPGSLPDWEGGLVRDLIEQAVDAGVITLPGGAARTGLVVDVSEDGDWLYQWRISLPGDDWSFTLGNTDLLAVQPAAGHSPAPTRGKGSRAALAVLREAADAGNLVLDAHRKALCSVPARETAPAAGEAAVPAWLSLDTIPAHARGTLRAAARLLGEAHAAAGLTPYATDRPADDYSRASGGYTAYIEHEDGVLLLLTALGVPLSEEDSGPWFEACWSIARAYTDGYDSVLMTPQQMVAEMRRIGIRDADLRGGTGDQNPAGTLGHGQLAVVYQAARVADDLPDAGMVMPLTLVIYEPGEGAGEPAASWAGLTPEAVLDQLASRHSQAQAPRSE
jgi:hypothetical protein